MEEKHIESLSLECKSSATSATRNQKKSNLNKANASTVSLLSLQSSSSHRHRHTSTTHNVSLQSRHIGNLAAMDDGVFSLLSQKRLDNQPPVRGGGGRQI